MCLLSDAGPRGLPRHERGDDRRCPDLPMELPRLQAVHHLHQNGSGGEIFGIFISFGKLAAKREAHIFFYVKDSLRFRKKQKIPKKKWCGFFSNFSMSFRKLLLKLKISIIISFSLGFLSNRSIINLQNFYLCFRVRWRICFINISWKDAVNKIEIERN